MSQSTKYSGRPFIIALVLGCIFFFLVYVVRASPAVMIPELSSTFKVSVLTVNSIPGVYYYTYAFTSLIAGMALDRAGAKYSISIGIGILSIGCVLFSFPHVFAGYSGRLFQGVG